MCLGVPGQVLEIDGMVATVEFFGVRRQVRLDVVDSPVAVGDFVMNHVGYAIRRIPAEEIGETMELYRIIVESFEKEDLMAQDVRGEIDAAAEKRRG